LSYGRSLFCFQRTKKAPPFPEGLDFSKASAFIGGQVQTAANPSVKRDSDDMLLDNSLFMFLILFFSDPSFITFIMAYFFYEVNIFFSRSRSRSDTGML